MGRLQFLVLVTVMGWIHCVHGYLHEEHWTDNFISVRLHKEKADVLDRGNFVVDRLSNLFSMKKNTKEDIQVWTAVGMLFAGAGGLSVAGFIVEPLGQIHDSVLWFCSMPDICWQYIWRLDLC